MALVSDAVASVMSQFGAEVIFQLTGGDPTFWASINRSGIRMIPARSEQGAVYMADGYARASGKVGWVYGQHGPGAANIASSLADPYWAGSPIVSITSSVVSSVRDRKAYQELDQLRLFGPVTAGAFEINQAEEVERILGRAVGLATARPRRPVHVQVPRDVFASELGRPVRRAIAPAEPSLPSAAKVEIEAAADLIESADRPVILAGSGALWSMPVESDLLTQLATEMGSPIVTTAGGKGVVDEHDACSIGVAGRYSSPAANSALGDADVVLVLGSSLGELATDGYTVPSADASIVHVDIDTRAFNATYESILAIHADVSFLVSDLLDVLRTRKSKANEDWLTHAAEQAASWRAQVSDEVRSHSRSSIHPGVVFAALNELPSNDMVVADTGYMAAWAAVLYRLKGAGLGFLRACGSLGWAVPGAIGAAIGAEENVIAIAGDGGLGYNIMEIETAVRCEIPVTIVVLNNQTLAFERHLQEKVLGDSIDHANDFSDVDYAAVADALGANGMRVDHADQVQKAISSAVGSKSVSLIDVHIDPALSAPVTAFR